MKWGRQPISPGDDGEGEPCGVEQVSVAWPEGPLELEESQVEVCGLTQSEAWRLQDPCEPLGGLGLVTASIR